LALNLSVTINPDLVFVDYILSLNNVHFIVLAYDVSKQLYTKGCG